MSYNKQYFFYHMLWIIAEKTVTCPPPALEVWIYMRVYAFVSVHGEGRKPLNSIS